MTTVPVTTTTVARTRSSRPRVRTTGSVDQPGRRVRLAGMPVEDERVGEQGQRQEEVRHDERGLQLEEHRQPAQDGLEEHADDEPD